MKQFYFKRYNICVVTKKQKNMEQITAFVLGVFSVLAVASVYSMFKTRSQVKDLYEEVEDLLEIINNIEDELNQETDLLDRRIDGEIDRLNDAREELYKYVDSRTDKMESRCEKQFEEILKK